MASLALHVRGRADALDAVGADAEAFTRRVLERCDAILEHRAPGRILLMRHLELSLRLAEVTLADGAEIEECARILADAIEAAAADGGMCQGSRVTDLDIAAFESEADWRGQYVGAAAQGRDLDAWYFQPLHADGSAAAFLTTADAEPLIHVLAALRRRGTLASTIAALPAMVAEGIARRLGWLASPSDARISPDLPPAVSAWLTTLPGSMRASDAWTAIAIAVFEETGSVSSDGSPSAMVQTAFNIHVSEPAERAAPLVPVEIDCAYAGVFYLLPVVMELTLGELLWRACVPEGALISDVARSLLGPDPDASLALQVFGGPAVDAAPPMGAEQCDEIGRGLLAAMIEAIPRHSGHWPEVNVQLTNVAAGRLLIAHDAITGQAVFAADAHSPDTIVAALETFLSAWPASAPPPRADRGLLAIDRRARLRPRKGKAAAPLIVEENSLAESALRTQIAGAIAEVFTTRLGLESDADALNTLRDVLSIPARLAFADDALVVQFPAERLDIRVRRAGLDIDPGWIPWLQRRVTFEYVDQHPGRG